MRTADEVAMAAIEVTCGGVCVNVKPHPAHVDPARVRTDLPTFVNRVKAAGLRVTQIRGPEITDPADPTLEAIVGTASQVGCTHYTLGSFVYDPTKQIMPQLDALKPRIEQFAKLSEKHKMRLMFDTVPVPNAVGALVWDLLHVMKDLDPKFVGVNWDTGHMALHGDGMWETLMRTAGPYVAGIGWRDRAWHQDIGLKGEGGPFPGPVARAGGAGGRAAGPPAGRAGGGAPAAGAPGGRGAGAEDVPAPRAGGPGGRGTPNFEMPHRPLSGLIARGNGWSAPAVAMGTGIVDVTKVVAILKEIDFNGPSTLQSEYSTLGGAESGSDKITLPRQFVVGLIKRDVLTIRKAFEMAANGLGI
jgi:sugar phosphate isomerase/epimerase